MPVTEWGKERAIAALWRRRQESQTRTKIDNSTLVAGAPMYFYCVSCGAVADVKPEAFFTPPRTLCQECDALKECGWLTE